MRKYLFNYLRFLNKKKYKYVGEKSEIPLTMRNIHHPSSIYIGDYVKLGSEMIIYATQNSDVVISNGTVFAPRCKIFTSNHNYNSNNLNAIPYDEVNIVNDVIIGEACWIGDSVIILSGVTIGKGVIIGSGCVVSKDIPDYAVVVGNPMKIVKYRDKKIFDELLEQKKFTLNQGGSKVFEKKG